MGVSRQRAPGGFDKKASIFPNHESRRCLQELLISPRVLHWTSHGLFLQFRSGYVLEGSSETWSTWDTGTILQPRLILDRPNEELLTMKGWPRMVNIFSHMKLSYATDRLHTIDGIARLIPERLGVAYFKGVFQSHLAQGLACMSSLSKRDKPKLPDFPSW